MKILVKSNVHSVLVIGTLVNGTLVNGTFVIGTKFSPRYLYSPDNVDPVNGELLYKIRYPDYPLSG